METRGADTRRRLFEAAGDEFAAYGLAGARTGRIAQAAGANEALLFRYFGSKQALFDQVYASLIEKTVDDVPLDAADLGAYAGALFDYYRSHEQVLRLAAWTALEGPTSAASAALATATAHKESAVAAAQQAGVVTARLPPAELLALVVQLSLTGASVSPTLGPVIDAEAQRRSIVFAVSAITAP